MNIENISLKTNMFMNFFHLFSKTQNDIHSELFKTIVKRI